MFSGILIRTEVFEHGIFPTPAKLTLHSIVSLFNSLALTSSIDNKVTLEQFKDSVSKYIPSIQARDAEAYFFLYKILTESDMSFLTKINTQQPIDTNIKSTSMQKAKSLSAYNSLTGSPVVADIRTLVVFVFLQTFMSSFRNNFELKQKEFNTQWEPHHQFTETIRGSLPNPHFSSPIHSPRSKTTRIAFTNEYNQMSFFLKANIRQVLKFVSIDLSSDENSNALITEAEFNMLRMLFQPERNDPGMQTLPLSKYTNLFKESPKVSINEASDWLANNSSLGDTGDVFYIQGLNKSVTVKDRLLCSNKEVRVLNCEESYIYIDACVKFISIVNCVNTTVFVASVKKVCTVDKCENLTLTVASNYLRVGNTIDSTINYYGSFNPVLYGDNRSIIIGPYNANYTELIDRIKEAEIPITFKNIQSYDNALVLSNPDNSNINHKIQKVEDFSNIILPENFKPIPHTHIGNYDSLVFGGNEDISSLSGTNCILPVLCPNTYRDNVKNRHKSYKDIQKEISQSGLGSEEQKILQFAIQSSYKEWLLYSGALKPIIEMAKMIDKE